MFPTLLFCPHFNTVDIPQPFQRLQGDPYDQFLFELAALRTDRLVDVATIATVEREVEYAVDATMIDQCDNVRVPHHFGVFQYTQENLFAVLIGGHLRQHHLPCQVFRATSFTARLPRYVF